MTPRIALAGDALLDSLKFLDRYSLDAVRLVSVRFDGLVDAMKDVCLRDLDFVAIVQPFHGNHYGRFTVRAGTKPGLPQAARLEFNASEADVAEVFKGMVRFAYVDRLGVYDVACTDGLLLAIKSFLPAVWVKKWLFNRNDLSPDIFIDTVLSAASISSMCMAKNWNTKVSHINDRLLIGLSKKGATEVIFDPFYETLNEPCGVTDRGVFSFLTAGTTKKRLRIQNPLLSASFFENLHEVIDGGRISAGSKLAIYQYGPLDVSAFAQYPVQEVPHYNQRTYQMGNVAKVRFSDYCEQLAEVTFSEE